MKNTLSLFILLQNEMIIYLMDELQNLILFGSKIKELREKKKLTQAELAEKIGFSTNFVGMIERAERNTTVANVFKFARALNTAPNEFFNF